MAKSNFERMIELAEDVFDVKSDPEQLDINQKVIERLQEIHPATLSEYDDGNGPVVWILVIPTSIELMNLFISKKISEKELFEKTEPGKKYEALYLCSAMVLKEFRGKGIAKRLTLEAIRSIQKDHPLKSLFVWPFSDEGDHLAETISNSCGLPLLKRLE
jgi:hypothetical protein